MAALPSWRSLLYVPADQIKMVESVHKRGADAIILDLEDGVAPAAKEAARANLKSAVPKVSQGGADVLVRINKPWSLAWRDIEAAVTAGARDLILPKVEDACQLRVISTLLDEIDNNANIGLIALIENAQGLIHVTQIASSSRRLRALIPGNEDLAGDLGIKLEPQPMAQVQIPLLLAARAANLKLYGTLGGSANFRDLEAYKNRVKLSKDWGFNGATCIHPKQIEIIHEVYQLDEARVKEAQSIVKIFEASAGRPVEFEGRMVDLPIYLRAKAIVDQAD